MLSNKTAGLSKTHHSGDLFINRDTTFRATSESKPFIISPDTRCAATWPLELELKVFLSNNMRMSTPTEICTARS